MQNLIRKEAELYAKWASGPHQTAVFNQRAGEWLRQRMVKKDCPVYDRMNCIRHRIALMPMVAESLMRRDGLVGPQGVRSLIGKPILVRVTK